MDGMVPRPTWKVLAQLGQTVLPARLLTSMDRCPAGPASTEDAATHWHRLLLMRRTPWLRMPLLMGAEAGSAPVRRLAFTSETINAVLHV